MLKYTNLSPNQVACIDFIDSGEDSLVLADVGAGKTVIGLTAAKRALERGDVTRWLIVAPKRVALHVWAQEAKLWEHLTDLEIAVACGPPAQRQAALDSNAPIVVTNYENLIALFEAHAVKRSKGKRVDTLPFDGLMCDEIDKLKSVSTNRFKEIRNRIDRFNKRVCLTGTPTPNSLQELWGIVYMTDGGATFGRSFYRWRSEYFYPTDFKQYNWAPFPGTFDKLVAALDGLAYRLEAEGVPPVVLQKPRFVDLTLQQRKLYAEFEKELYAKFEREGAWYELDADNQGVAQGKLEQICAGFSYVGEDDAREAVWHSKAKIDALRTVQRVFHDKQLMVGYWFKEELAELERVFPPKMFRWIGKSDAADRETIEAWNNGSLPIIGVHPASAGHGLNLQKSGAHVITSLTLPWSGGLFRQWVGRLARRGQTAAQVDVWPILARNTIDELKLEVIENRISTQAEFVDALKKRRS